MFVGAGLTDDEIEATTDDRSTLCNICDERQGEILTAQWDAHHPPPRLCRICFFGNDSEEEDQSSEETEIVSCHECGGVDAVFWVKQPRQQLQDQQEVAWCRYCEDKANHKLREAV